MLSSPCPWGTRPLAPFAFSERIQAVDSCAEVFLRPVA